jgi:hypothetical protein
MRTHITHAQLTQPSIERDGLIWFQPRAHQKFWVSRVRGRLALTALTIAYTRRQPPRGWRWSYRLFDRGLPVGDYASFDAAAAAAAQLLLDGVVR